MACLRQAFCTSTGLILPSNTLNYIKINLHFNQQIPRCCMQAWNFSFLILKNVVHLFCNRFNQANLNTELFKKGWISIGRVQWCQTKWYISGNIFDVSSIRSSFAEHFSAICTEINANYISNLVLSFSMWVRVRATEYKIDVWSSMKIAVCSSGILLLNRQIKWICVNLYVLHRVVFRCDLNV